MMHTRLTTLQTPCDTGLTRWSVLKANCEQGMRVCMDGPGGHVHGRVFRLEHQTRA